MQMRLFYRTDPWLSYESRELIGAFTNKRKAVKALKACGATDEQIDECFNYPYQSQCSGENHEFDCDFVERNVNLLVTD